MLLLGSRFWNDDGVVVAADGKLDGAVFVDAYDRYSRSQRMENFNSLHLLTYGHRNSYQPPSYFTALAYDTQVILKNLISNPANLSPVALAEALTSMQAHPGVTGLTAFLETGEAVKESMFFTINEYGIRRIVP